MMKKMVMVMAGVLAGAVLSARSELPKVLMVGDSIAGAYIDVVARELRGRATVYWWGNASHTDYGLANYDNWIGTTKWAVIYFNHGLHDIKLPTVGRDHEIPIEQYAKNMEAISARLKATGAHLIFATTTPILEPKAAGESRRNPEDVVRYNAAAVAITERHGIILSDLYAHALDDIENLLKSDGVHFNEKGARLLEKEVGKHILRVLNQGR